MDALISVIVPVYNVEDYLDRCVESIVNQTYNNLEIILIDDGSPDSCPEMCNEWAEKDSRIIVVHKENGGLSDARNAGLKVATGEYISFIDSDDWININFYEQMYRTIINEKSEIVQCERDIVSDCTGEYLKNIIEYDSLTVSDEQAISMLIDENKFRQVVWNKLYKRSIIKHCFLKGIINEDEFWTYKVFGETKRITYINAVMYYYFLREESIMRSNYSLKRLDGLKALIERHEFICERYPNLKDKSNNSVYGSCMYHYQMILKHITDNNKKTSLKQIKKIAKTFYPNLKTIENKKYKIWVCLSKHMFGLICSVRAILGIGF